MIQGRFAVLASKHDIICIINYTGMPYIALDSQMIKLSYNINHIHEDIGIF